MLGFYIYKYSLYAVIYIGIALAGIANHKYIETVFLLVSFVALRYCFPKTFHCNIVYNCVFWSIILFWVGVPQTLPITISMFSSVIVGFVITYVLYLVQDYVDFKTKAELTLFDLPKDRLQEYIDNSTLKDEEKLALKFYVIDHYKGEQFYNAMGYSKRQCLRIYKSAVNKLNNLIRH